MEAVEQGTRIILHIAPSGLQMEAPTGMPHAQIHWFLTLAAKIVMDQATVPQNAGLSLAPIPEHAMRAIMESVKSSQKAGQNGG